MLNDLIRAARQHGISTPTNFERVTYGETPAFYVLARTYEPGDVDHKAVVLSQISARDLFSATANELRDKGLRNWERLVPTLH